ncbi:unnamed protein product [Caenorhabditis brenneri]
MAQAPAHPFLSLPDDEIIQKIREMSLEEVLKFSLISKRCKDLVKSIQIEGTSISVSIENDITIFMKTDSLMNLQLRYYTRPEEFINNYSRKKKLATPRTIEVNVFDNDGDRISGPTLTYGELTMKAWLKHLQDIFNYDEVDSIEFSERSIDFDIDDIREVFGNKSRFEMLFLDTDAYRQLTLVKFFPIEKLSIMMSNFQDSKVPANILIQNFEYLSIEDLSGDEVITLDELSPKDFNKFIKLWQQGSNLHMEYLSIHCLNDEEDEEDVGRVMINEEYNENIIMKGIKHDVVPANQIRKFKTVESKNPCLVHGGMDIHRNDGVNATIQTEKSLFTTIWHMYVWLDHCVVE